MSLSYDQSAVPPKRYRRVFVCQKCRDRKFLKPDIDAGFVPICQKHGPMVRQMNMPYRGHSTEPPEGWGWPPAVDDPKAVLR